MILKYTVIILASFVLALLLFLQVRRNDFQEIVQEKAIVPQPLLPEPQLWPTDTIPALSNKVFTGNQLRIQKKLEENETYIRSSIAYTSEGFTVSGILVLPQGEGPFPVVVLNHGYVDPEKYQHGEGLKREQDFFARNGFAVLYSDYRNHALSDFDPGNEIRPRSGYVEDVLNLISAAEKAHIPELDMENLFMLGFSLGGGITLNIMTAKPDTARAYALFAPIHADYRVNFDTRVVPEWPETAEEFYRTYGTPEDNPQFWHDISAENFFERITRPIILHQGTRDGEVPVEWSRDLAKNLKPVGKDVSYYEYNEPHIFGASQALAMERTLTFFENHLR